MDWTLEVIPIPVSDVDRAKAFYSERVGFNVDLDTRIDDDVRLVQLTPPGSRCSIHLNTGLEQSPPGSLQGMQLIVSDIDAARTQLLAREVEVSEIQHFENGEWVVGRGGDWNAFAFFSDPDGNGWVLQERPEKRPER